MEAEIDTHLAGEIEPNRKNGKSRKTMKTSSASFELETPRDRAGTFEPQLINKHQTHVSDEIKAKILSMFGLGMSYRDISIHNWSLALSQLAIFFEGRLDKVLDL